MDNILPLTVSIRAQLEPAIKRAFANATVTLAPQSADPRERLAFVVNR